MKITVCCHKNPSNGCLQHMTTYGLTLNHSLYVLSISNSTLLSVLHLTKKFVVPGDLIMSSEPLRVTRWNNFVGFLQLWALKLSSPSTSLAMAVTNGSTGRCDGRRGPEGGSNGVMWLRNSWSWCIPLMLNVRPGALVPVGTVTTLHVSHHQSI